MKGNLGSFESTSEVKPIDVPQNKDGKSETPSDKKLVDLLKEIFNNNEGSDGRETKLESSGIENNPLEDKDSGKIILPDGTVIELPEPMETLGTDDSEKSCTEKDDVENKKTVEGRIKELLTTPQGLNELIENNPKLAEKWEKAKEAIEVLHEPEKSDKEKIEANRYLGQFKGALLEAATKKALVEAGLYVEDAQRQTEGENGATRPDVIAKNNTNDKITVFGVIVNPGETISIECKCASKQYISNELNTHIPNQLSGQEGKRVLLTSSDVDVEKAIINQFMKKLKTDPRYLDFSNLYIKQNRNDVSKMLDQGGNA